MEVYIEAGANPQPNPRATVGLQVRFMDVLYPSDAAKTGKTTAYDVLLGAFIIELRFDKDKHQDVV